MKTLLKNFLTIIGPLILFMCLIVYLSLLALKKPQETIDLLSFIRSINIEGASFGYITDVLLIILSTLFCLRFEFCVNWLVENKGLAREDAEYLVNHKLRVIAVVLVFPVMAVVL